MHRRDFLSSILPILISPSILITGDTDISTIPNRCFEQMLPGMLYLNRIRINYKPGWEYPSIKPSTEIALLSFQNINRKITEYLTRIKVPLPIESEDMHSILNQKPIRIGNNRIIIGYPFIEDSVAWEVIETTSKSHYPIYSPDISWLWSDVPNRVPDPIRCVGGWLERLGYMEWTITPSISATNIQSIEICQPKGRASS